MTYLKKYAIFNRISHYWWLYVLLLANTSCNQKSVESGRYTDAFMPVYNQTTKLFDANETEKGLHYLDSAFKQLANPSYSDRFRYYGFHYVHYQKAKKDYQSALLYADSMMMMANRSEGRPYYVTNFAEANFAKGDTYFDLNQFNDSFQCYYQGYLTGKNYLNNEALSDYTYRMGMIMYKKAHYKAAAGYFKESYNKKNLTKIDDFVAYFRKQELLDNIGLSYRHNNDNDSALVYFDKTLSLIDENAPKFPEKKDFSMMARGVVYGNKAEVYIQEGAYDKAIDLLKKSIAINLQKGFDNIDAQYAELKLGKIYSDQQESALLINLLNDLRNQLNTVKNGVAEAEWHRLMGDYYLQKHELQSALEHMQQYNQLKDSITKQSNLLRESDVNEQLANYEKAHQIELLSENNKLQKTYLYVIIVVGLMGLVIMFLVYRNWRRSKKDVMMVNVLNKQINEQNSVLEKALNELNISSQEKDRILRTVAHDLRNPIGGIASLTTIMADDEFTDEQKELINLVKETSFNSLELINEILEATNISLIELNLEPVEVNSLVNNSVELLRFKAAEKGQQILFEPLNNQQELYISREKIWRVISNLVSNAIKFSPTGALIFVKVERTADQVVISVKDNGIGIPEKLRDQVFNMFTSAQRPGTAGEKSFGLGLSICRQIMEKSNGSIWFESGKQGTTFFISLPLSDTMMPNGSTQKIGVPLA